MWQVLCSSQVQVHLSLQHVSLGAGGVLPGQQVGTLLLLQVTDHLLQVMLCHLLLDTQGDTSLAQEKSLRNVNKLIIV